jgi:hypothetical protein
MPMNTNVFAQLQFNMTLHGCISLQYILKANENSKNKQSRLAAQNRAAKLKSTQQICKKACFLQFTAFTISDILHIQRKAMHT